MTNEAKNDWRYVAIDETAQWHEKIANQCGRIFGVYVFDASLRVYCAELTPSYELYFLRSEPEHTPDDDAACERLLDSISEADCATERVSYVHCWSIDTDRCKQVGYEPDEDDTRDSREQADDVLCYACEAYENVPLPESARA